MQIKWKNVHKVILYVVNWCADIGILYNFYENALIYSIYGSMHSLDSRLAVTVKRDGIVCL